MDESLPKRTVILKGGPLDDEPIVIGIHERTFTMVGVFPEGRYRFTWVQRSDDEPHLFDYLGQEMWRSARGLTPEI